MNGNDLQRLIPLIKNNNQSAMAELIGGYQKQLLRFCYFLTRNPPLAQDICQESFIKAIEKINQLRDILEFKSWLYKIARNLFLDYQKSPQNHNFSIENFDEFDQHFQYSENPEELSHIAHTLSSLSDDDRLILLLIDLEKYSYRETSEILNISEDAVRSRLHRAKASFRKEFGND